MRECRPSSAHRWMTCSGQPWVATVAKMLPEEKYTYTAEGTAAHEYLHSLLTDSQAECDLSVEQKAVVERVCREIKRVAEVNLAKIVSEETISYTFKDLHTMEMTPDVLIISEKSLMVLDYKHGQRTVVAENNPQLMLYLMAAAEKYPREEYGIAILQGGKWDTMRVSPQRLGLFREQVTDAIRRVYSDPQYVIGTYCSMCPGYNGLCPAMIAVAIQTCAKSEDTEAPIPWGFLELIPQAKMFLTKLEKYAMIWLKAGRRVPGYRLDTQPGKREWKDPDKVAEELASIIGGEKEDYQKSKPIGVIAAEAMAQKEGVLDKIKPLMKQGFKYKRVKDLGMKSLEKETNGS